MSHPPSIIEPVAQDRRREIDSSRRGSWLLSLVMLVAAAVAAQAQEARLVPDIVAQFASIDYQGDAIAWNLGVADDPSICKHYQGVVRYNDPNGVPYLFLTRSGNVPDNFFCDQTTDGIDEPGELVVVRMGSRPTHGERMRSNLWAPNKKTKDTAPPSSDWAVKHFHFSTMGGVEDWPGLVQAMGSGALYHHPGSPQILEDVLAIPLEEPGSGSTLTETRVLFVDISDPFNPVPLYSKATPHQSGKLGSLGLARRPADGKIHFAFVNSSDASTISFCQSTANSEWGTDLKAGSWGFEYEFNWAASTGFVNSAPWGNWQTTHLFIGDDGELYVACAGHNNQYDTGDDIIALYRWAAWVAPNQFKLEYVWQRHLQLRPTITDVGGVDLGILSGASGYYVSPAGALMFYSCGKSNPGPNGSVNMGEFRSDGHDLNDPSSGPFDQREFQNLASCGGWVEIYEKKKGWKTNDVGNSWIFDYEDRNADDWQDFGLLDCNRDTILGIPVLGHENCLGDNASSLRWDLPYGRIARLYKDKNYQGKYLQLEGRGEIPNLSSSTYPWSDDPNSFDQEDQFSSIRFMDFGNGVSGIIVKPYGVVIDVGSGPIPAQSWSNKLDRYGVRNGVLMMACENAASMSAGNGTNQLLIYPGNYAEAASWTESGSFIISQPMRIERYNPNGALPPSATVVIGGF